MNSGLKRKGHLPSDIRQRAKLSSIALRPSSPLPLAEARRKDEALDFSAKFVEALSGKPMRRRIELVVMPVFMADGPHYWLEKHTIYLPSRTDASKAVHELVHAQHNHKGKGFIKTVYREGLATFAMDVFNGHTQYFWLLFDKPDYVPFTRSLHGLSKLVGDPAKAFQIAAARAPETFWQLISPKKFYKEEIAAAKQPAPI